MSHFTSVQSHLSTLDFDGWLLYDFRGSNPIALHMAGIQQSGSRRWFLWIPARGRPVFLVHAIEVATFRDAAKATGADLRIYVGWQQLEEQLAELVRGENMATCRIAMEYSPRNAIPYVSTVDAGAKELVEAATGATIVSSADLVQMAQAVLSPEQMAGHRRAAAHCLAVKDQAFAFIAQRLRADRPVDEYAVQQFIMERMSALKLDPDHPPIVSVNANAAIPHYAPSIEQSSPIRPGDMVLIDLWARERMGPQACFADITWTAYCGATAPDKVRQVFAVVAQARTAAIDLMQERINAGRPVHGYEVDDACRQVIVDAGFGPYFVHRTGHSLGTEMHFRGVNLDNLETQDRRRLIPGVMVTVEPGIYMPDFDTDGHMPPKGLGIRSEVNCLIHQDRVEVTTLPLQTEVIPLLSNG